MPSDTARHGTSLSSSLTAIRPGGGQVVGLAVDQVALFGLEALGPPPAF
jgi:hypothetical protein